MTGLGQGAALLSSVGVGAVNFCFTLLAVNIIDRFGWRKLMLIGSVGLIATLGLVAQAFYRQQFGGVLVPVLRFAYAAGALVATHQGATPTLTASDVTELLALQTT
jgi:hypothetical protein